MTTLIHPRPAEDTKINRHSTDQEKFDELIRVTLESGMDRAKIIDTDLVVVERRAGMKCLIPRCTSYGRSYTCPPNVPSTKEVRELMGEYSKALFVQVDGSEDIRDLRGCHVELRQQFYLAAGSACVQLQLARDSNEVLLEHLK